MLLFGHVRPAAVVAGFAGVARAAADAAFAAAYADSAVAAFTTFTVPSGSTARDVAAARRVSVRFSTSSSGSVVTQYAASRRRL